jgi:hypothetical protein
VPGKSLPSALKSTSWGNPKYPGWRYKLTLKLEENVSVANGGVITAASLLLHGKDSIPPHTNAPIPKTLRNFLSIF